MDRRQPRLPDHEREMLLGWHDVVEAIFEVRALDADGVVLHNLIDDLVYHVRSNMGTAVFATLRKRMFIAGRIVPVHPATDEWLVSGHFSKFDRSDARQLAHVALQVLTSSPRALCRNPDMVRRAWQMHAQYRAYFVEFFGSDLVILPPATAQRKMTEYYRRMRSRIDAGRRSSSAGITAEEESFRLSDELMDSETIALVYDEVEGLNYYAEFGRLDDLFADPSLVKDRSRLASLRRYLRDDSVSPMAVRRLVQRHPTALTTSFARYCVNPPSCGNAMARNFSADGSRTTSIANPSRASRASRASRSSVIALPNCSANRIAAP